MSGYYDASGNWVDTTASDPTAVPYSTQSSPTTGAISQVSANSSYSGSTGTTGTATAGNSGGTPAASQSIMSQLQNLTGMSASQLGALGSAGLGALASYLNPVQGTTPQGLQNISGFTPSVKAVTQTGAKPGQGATYFKPMAQGGLAYLRTHEDGMKDTIPANIAGKHEAALSGGEFVVPADVVSHLGNGNSEAGAKQLYDMMDRIRQARTGTTEQGKEIDPNKYVPS